MTQTRQLAAIMFTDIVGYTTMMQTNEPKAVAVIKHYNSELEKLVSQYNGRVLNYYGDGSLCIFHNATDATPGWQTLKFFFSFKIFPLSLRLPM